MTALMIEDHKHKRMVYKETNPKNVNYYSISFTNFLGSHQIYLLLLCCSNYVITHYW